jgi:hypothetical protein
MIIPKLRKPGRLGNQSVQGNGKALFTGNSEFQIKATVGVCQSHIGSVADNCPNHPSRFILFILFILFIPFIPVNPLKILCILVEMFFPTPIHPMHAIRCRPGFAAKKVRVRI